MRSPQSLPELPTLDSEIYRLTTETDTRSILAALTVDHALLNDGPVYWLDACNHAATDPITAVAPSPRILDRIHVARGFTPYQHYSIADALVSHVEADPPGLIVVPAVDALYEETATGVAGDELLARTVARLTAINRVHDCPVLLTTVRDDMVSASVFEVTDVDLRCEQTCHGPRFVGGDFETLVYPVGKGWVQTTIAYWQSIIDARQSVYAAHGHSTPAEELIV